MHIYGEIAIDHLTIHAMKQIWVKRTYHDDNVTLSDCILRSHDKTLLTFKGLELPWRQNKKGISCIPEGLYRAVAVRRTSNKMYAIWIQDVPGRSEVMIHTANYVRELRGCLAPGVAHIDIDGDGIIDIRSSQMIMDTLQLNIPLGDEIEVMITSMRKETIGNLDPKTEKRV
jgi:hypothetical protein